MTETEKQAREAGAQLALLCACGKPIEVKRLARCRSCYDRRHHSFRFFGGLREGVLQRDGLRCRGCGSGAALLVHHRGREDRAESLITLCIRCHMRIHHASASRYWFPRMLLRLWRELHIREPVQLQLALEDVARNALPLKLLEAKEHSSSMPYESMTKTDGNVKLSDSSF